MTFGWNMVRNIGASDYAAGTGAQVGHSHRNRRVIAAAVLVIVLHAASLPAWGGEDQVFTWTDANGTVHFSNSAPAADANATARTLTRSDAGPSAGAPPGFTPVPLDVRDNQKMVRAHLEGRHAAMDVRMIVDTGAQKTMIAPEIADRLGVAEVGEGMMQGVVGADVFSVVELEGFQVGAAELRHVEVMVGKREGLNLLGADVLNRLELRVGTDTLDRETR